MAVDRVVPAVVLDHQHAAVSGLLAVEVHLAPRRGVDRGALRNVEVDAVVVLADAENGMLPPSKR